MAASVVTVGAPAQEHMEEPPQVEIECLKRDNPTVVQQLASLHHDGFGSKRCCLCFGDSQGEIASSLRSGVATVPDSKLSAYGVAMLDGEAVGFAQLGFHDTPGDFLMPSIFQSTPRVGTCHLERIVVSSKMRGKGIGQKLLHWVDSKARDRGCSKVMLEVVSGNPAKGLYERHGYVSHTPVYQKVCMCPCIFCLMGYIYVDVMNKPL
ncbi:unnamed protein product [Effrenium voratum]|nr:unnamed protein product [Effrenium voratum]